MMKIKHLSAMKATLFLSALSLISCSGSSQEKESIKFYVGSSGQQEHSIFLCELDAETQKFARLDSFSGAAGASYLAPSNDFTYIYAISKEISDPELKHSSLTSFEVNPETLGLSLINSRSSEGSRICHIPCSQDGKHVFAANYGSGHASALPLSKNGQIEAATAVVIGEGGGPVESRQDGPHAHQVMLDPSQSFLLVPDLGTDKVMIYAFDPSSGQLSPNPVQPFFSMAPGAGPRHLDFHPNGNFLYVVNELNSTLTACQWNSSLGKLDEINTESTVEDGHEGMKYPAAVRVHPNGDYVYASTRGENSCISVFRTDEDGSITRIQVMEQVPFWPRDFNLDPSGRFLISAGERSNDIRLYNIDQESGMLLETGSTLELPAPANILFIQ
jgi:6-phosphogluconolactonase